MLLALIDSTQLITDFWHRLAASGLRYVPELVVLLT